MGKVQVSRHGERPHTSDYIKNIFNDIILLHGDKKYADDSAIVGGLAKIDNNSIFFIEQKKEIPWKQELSITLVWLNQRDIEKFKDC